MNKKSIISFVTFFIIVLGGVFLFKDNISNLYSKLLLKLPEIEKGFNDLVIQEIKKQVFTPPPLRSDSQEEQITQILQPVVATIRSQHQKHKTFACDLATKIGEGTLAKEDILAAMNLRQKSAKANQSMVADAILNVYKALNEEQRKTISENMKKRLANLGN